MDAKDKMTVPDRNMGVSMAAKKEYKKNRHPRKDVSISALSREGRLKNRDRP